MNYKKLYFLAFNEITDILQKYDYPNNKNTVLQDLAMLQQTLEEYYISDEEKKQNKTAPT